MSEVEKYKQEILSYQSTYDYGITLQLIELMLIAHEQELADEREG